MRAAALAALLLVLATTACGGGSQRDPLGGAAVFVPAGVVAFLAARADATWQPLLRTVLHRDPPHLPKDTVEVDVAVLQGGTTVVMTKPKHGDWRGTAATSQQPSLADNVNYLAAVRAGPANATAQAYVRGDVAGERLAAVPGQIATINGIFRNDVRVRPHLRTRTPQVAQLRWRWLSAWATKDGYGARLRSGGKPVARVQVVHSLQRVQPAYSPSLLDEIPADAQRVVDVTLSPSAFSFLTAVPASVRALVPHAGSDLALQLDRLTGGETALYTRAGGETTLVTSPSDVTAAQQALHDLRLTGLHTATIGGQFVVSTTAQGIAAFRGGGPKLAGKADIPPATAGFVWERGKTAAWAGRDGSDVTFTVRFLNGAS